MFMRIFSFAIVLCLSGAIHCRAYTSLSKRITCVKSNVMAVPNSSLHLRFSQEISSQRCVSTKLHSSNKDSKLQETDKEFWLKQKQLIQELSDLSNKAMRAGQREKFARQRIALVGDTAFLGFLIFCGLWSAFENPFVALSYALGSTLGVAYAYGLGKYVENLGGSAYDAEAGKGAGVGEARFAFLILLFVLVGKFQNSGLIVVPTIAGFFTYQIASLSQGLKQDIDDE